MPGEEATPWVGWWSRFTLRERASGVAAGRWVEPRVWLWIFAVGVIGMFRERGRRGFGEAERGIEGWFGREGRPCGHGLVPHEGIRGDFAIVEHFLEPENGEGARALLVLEDEDFHDEGRNGRWRCGAIGNRFLWQGGQSALARAGGLSLDEFLCSPMNYRSSTVLWNAMALAV